MPELGDYRKAPTWDGSQSTFQQYVIEVDLYVAAIRWEERYLCGPRLRLALTGAAATSVRQFPRDEFSHTDGADRLIAHLRDHVARPQLPEVGSQLEVYFTKLHRQKGESMSAWCVRSAEAYYRVQQALSRVPVPGQVNIFSGWDNGYWYDGSGWR